MKRSTALILTVLLIAVLSGCCPKYESPFLGKYVGNGENAADLDLPESAVEQILSVLNSGTWHAGNTKCGHDYELYTKREDIRYHSVCGTFTDLTNRRYMTLPKEERTAINALLGATEAVASDSDASITFLHYNWHGYGIGTKRVANCALVDSIIAGLNDLAETGEIVKKISDDPVDEHAGQLPVDGGTLWIETDCAIYRLSPDLTKICRVEDHLGKGYVLAMTGELKMLISNAWHYHPYDSYVGTFDGKTGSIEISHPYAASTSVHFHVKKIAVVKNDDYYPVNKIVLDVISTIDQTLTVRLTCQQSDDNLGAGDGKTVTLRADEAQEIELAFIGWKDFPYQIDISADKTHLQMRIVP